MRILCHYAVLVGAFAAAAHAVDFPGVYTQNFDAMGTSGTTAPTGWSFYGGMGGGNATWATSIPASDAGLGAVNATLIASTATTVSSNTQGYNYAATAATSNRAFGTSPTTGRGVALQLILTNSSGTSIQALRLRYDIRRFTAPGVNELPGYWLFYSLNNGTTWANVATLNPVTTTVPNSTGTSVMVETNLALASAWANGADLLFRWIDDNALETSPDQIIGLDNVRISTLTIPSTNTALHFDGVNDYVTMGAAPELGAGGSPGDGLTLECWFFKDGTGVTSSSGNGGVTGVPLFGKGRGEAESSNVDCDYFLGINTSGRLVADFEAYPATGITAGQNYPITGSNTPIVNNQWYHAAVTYDVATYTWRMYLDGVQVGTATAAANARPRFDSIQHFAIGAALTSAGAREGAFAGTIDEVRVWNYARSASEILAARDLRIASAPGLLGAFGLDEGAGAVAVNSNGTVVGALTNGPAWATGVPIGDSNQTPTATINTPVGGASLYSPASFAVEASAADADGAITQVEFLRNGTVVATDTTAPYSYAESNLGAGVYTYAARATDDEGGSGTSSPVIITVTLDPNNLPSGTALWFDGVDDYVTVGSALGLGAGGPPSNGMTLECWFRKEGAGVTSTSGSGGVVGIPLFAKGRGENDGSNVDCNYFFGINGSGQLVADFEAYPATGITAGQNYPITGTHAAIANGQWHHAAVTYDGVTATWKMYLDGVDVGSATAADGALPRYDSIQHFGIGAALNSTGVREGAFAGVIDEVRVWDYARSGSEIAAAKNVGLAGGSGLVGRFGLNEGTGAATASSVGVSTGALTNGPMWVEGAPLTPNSLPAVAVTGPADQTTLAAPADVTLTAHASDSDGSVAKVEFFVDGAKVGEDEVMPFRVNLTHLAAGDYLLSAKATDDQGASATSAVITLHVTPPVTESPVIALTLPANGASYLAPATISLQADASDPDGSVDRVEFFHGATKLGEDTTAPYTLAWSNVPVGTYTLTARVTDNLTATTTSAPVTVNVVGPVSSTLIAKGDTWKYLDDGSNQGTGWKEPAFNDSAWASGQAPLGGGDSHIVTNVNLGPSGARYITTYFRRTFDLPAAGAVQGIDLNVMRDDGVVVYINGIEVARQNLPDGAVDYLTNTPVIISGTEETTYFASTASPLPPLVDGTNVIAVELHQRDATSSDLGFDLEMIVRSLPGTPPQVALTSPETGRTFEAPATVSLSAAASDADGFVAKVEFFEGANKLGEDTTAPYTYSWTGVAQGSYSLTARATDNFGLTAISDLATITVNPPDTVPPAVAMISPANDASFLAPATIDITVAASDSDGSIAKVELFQGSTKLGEDTGAPFTFTWTGVVTGEYVLTAKATDNMTASTVSAPVAIHVVPNQAPVVSGMAPAASAQVSIAAAELEIAVSDPENQPLTVTFYGRPKTGSPGQDFTLVTLPDTQFYSENNNNRLTQFTSQTSWIVSQKDALNIAFVAHMGDMVQNGDTYQQEWINADSAMDLIEDPVTTLLTHGIPWGGAPGNHDFSPIGNPSGTSTYWNQYFGVSRWAGRTYFRGNYGANNNNNYQFFSASGRDFIVINLAYNSNTSGDASVLAWADALLKAYPERRAIITSHWIVNTGNPASWGGHGQAIYQALRGNPNLFLMLCGHVHGEGRRSDTYDGRTVHSVLQDYQDRSDGLGGGGSWLRYFVFSPANNAINAKTYRTTTGAYETDDDSQFTLSYDMASPNPWVDLGTISVPAGAHSAALSWTGLVAGTEYEWYAGISDGTNATSTGASAFTAVALPAVSITATDAAAGEAGIDQQLEFRITRAGDTRASLTVPVLAGGTAGSGVDYAGFSGDVVIAAGQASVTLSLTVLPDEQAEGPEIVILSIGTDVNLVAGKPATAQAQIADQPAASFYFANISDPAKRTPQDDADGDGRPNAIEYFMGSMPGDAASGGGFELPVAEPGTFKVRYPRARNHPGVTGVLEWSTDLVHWHTSGESDGALVVSFQETEVSPPLADPASVETTATMSEPAQNVFVRLRVE